MLWSLSHGKSDFTRMPKGRCPFEVWLNGLRDLKARAIIRERIARLMLGNFGDAMAIGEGVLEMRVALGPGYRIYCAEDGKRIVVLLCGGSKRRISVGQGCFGTSTRG
jgi:putative addiction module killer protein